MLTIDRNPCPSIVTQSGVFCLRLCLGWWMHTLGVQTTIKTMGGSYHHPWVLAFLLMGAEPWGVGSNFSWWVDPYTFWCCFIFGRSPTDRKPKPDLVKNLRGWWWPSASWRGTSAWRRRRGSWPTRRRPLVSFHRSVRMFLVGWVGVGGVGVGGGPQNGVATCGLP